MIQTIIKIGGSLLDLPDLNNRIQTLLPRFNTTPTWVMCGGGEYADSIRARQPLEGWCDAEAHNLAVLAMDANTYETSELLGLKVVELTYPQSEHHEANYTGIAVSHFLNGAEPQCEGIVLPQNWSATSDSIAARIATVYDIPNVVLLKSAAPPSEDLETLQDCGYIDSAFISMLSENTNVQFINLRG